MEMGDMNKRQLIKRMKKMEALLEKQDTLIQIDQEKDESREDYYIDRLQRLQAEFDNYRKRTIREKSEIANRARMEVLTDFLDLFDTLQKATEQQDPDESDEVKAYREGVELIQNQFSNFLKKEGVTKIETEGEKFDPNFHDALMMDKGEEDHAGYVSRELQSGYMYKDKVLRASKVSVFE
jgi:molecular chaperone GrpE